MALITSYKRTNKDISGEAGHLQGKKAKSHISSNIKHLAYVVRSFSDVSVAERQRMADTTLFSWKQYPETKR